MVKSPSVAHGTAVVHLLALSFSRIVALVMVAVDDKGTAHLPEALRVSAVNIAPERCRATRLL